MGKTTYMKLEDKQNKKVGSLMPTVSTAAPLPPNKRAVRGSNGPAIICNIIGKVRLTMSSWVRYARTHHYVCWPNARCMRRSRIVQNSCGLQCFAGVLNASAAL